MTDTYYRINEISNTLQQKYENLKSVRIIYDNLIFVFVLCNSTSFIFIFIYYFILTYDCCFKKVKLYRYKYFLNALESYLS